MSTSLMPAPDAAPEPLLLPVALTEADANRISAAISAARTESTRRVYAYTWGRWARWCAARNLSPLPGDPAALCAYLTERAAAGIAVSSLDGACTAIRHVHRMHGLDDPVASETVRQVRLGLRRTYGTAPRRLARPLSTGDIRQILHGIDRTTPVGVRDAALILLGYASAMRRSEIVALTLLDVEEKPDGLLVTDRRSDQEGHSQIVAVARGSHPETDPLAAMAAWRRLRGHDPGPLFTRFFRSRISLHPLSGDAIARMLRTRAHDAGLDATRVTAHSLRAGHATTAALGGVPLARIAAQTRHKDLSVLVNRYIRPLEALATTSSRDLGL
ncbi:MAG TPA: tyrosine-type recombinase/integrase [Nocardioidaceae bacterium]|nr:tyrosine-type recombinase/integrase [Nocardioidaceae bacterium]